jgi:hypothetical protein
MKTFNHHHKAKPRSNDDSLWLIAAVWLGIAAYVIVPTGCTTAGGYGAADGDRAVAAPVETGLGREVGSAIGGEIGGRHGYTGSVLGGAVGSITERNANRAATGKNEQ